MSQTNIKIVNPPSAKPTLSSVAHGTIFLLGEDNVNLYIKLSLEGRHYAGSYEMQVVCLTNGVARWIDSPTPVRVVVNIEATLEP